jgi:hypothetical protein
MMLDDFKEVKGTFHVRRKYYGDLPTYFLFPLSFLGVYLEHKAAIKLTERGFTSRQIRDVMGVDDWLAGIKDHDGLKRTRSYDDVHDDPDFDDYFTGPLDSTHDHAPKAPRTPDDPFLLNLHEYGLYTMYAASAAYLYHTTKDIFLLPKIFMALSALGGIPLLLVKGTRAARAFNAAVKYDREQKQRVEEIEQSLQAEFDGELTESRLLVGDFLSAAQIQAISERTPGVSAPVYDIPVRENNEPRPGL